ncbi:TolC family protein, partial [Acinetobacter baumannii]
ALSIAVAASVARRYFAILALRRRIAIARENSAAITAILDVIRVRVKVGVASSLDLAREQAQVEGVQAQLSTLEVEERRAVFALAVLV